MLLLLVLVACSEPRTSDSAASPAGPSTVPWSRELPSLAAELGPVRGLVPKRAIVHLHSAWSHDACDGDPLPDGAPNAPCVADLRQALCDTRVDAAFLTDHPAHAAEQPYEALPHPQPGDEVLPDGIRITCDDGHVVTWMPGIEDELMPVGLDRHVSDDPAENDRIYNLATEESVAAELAAGASIVVPHTESRDPAHLAELQDLGVAGVEIFNLHAMFDPDIRSDIFGLDAFGWIGEVEPFTSASGTAEPDLLVLGVLQEQAPTIERWDTLLARGPMAGVAGTDAHQNVLPIPLRDGERGDSYRRSLRWFSNVVLASGDAPADLQAALAAGRSYVAFEILGTPAGFDVHLEAADGAIVEMGGAGPGGTLVVGCPTLSPSSPRGAVDPEITVVVRKDGAIWQTGCGRFPTAGPGVYRVDVTVVPRHLEPFLGDAPDVWMKAYPWVYGNAIRVDATGS